MYILDLVHKAGDTYINKGFIRSLGSRLSDLVFSLAKVNCPLGFSQSPAFFQCMCTHTCASAYILTNSVNRN